ncbi:hypothetical protein D3C74_440520 [compost metagenome]
MLTGRLQQFDQGRLVETRSHIPAQLCRSATVDDGNPLVGVQIDDDLRLQFSRQLYDRCCFTDATLVVCHSYDHFMHLT